MSWKKLSPAVVAILLALPAVAVVQPASAQTGSAPTVPIAPSVEWQNQINWLHNLYIDFEVNEGGDAARRQVPDCIENAQLRDFALDLDSRLPGAGTQNTRSSCTFMTAPTTNVGSPGSVTVKFTSRMTLLRPVNVTGNDALKFVYRGDAPSGGRVDVVVRGSNTGPLTGSHVVQSGRTSDFAIDVPLGETGRYTFNAGDAIIVELKLTAPPGDASFAPVGWELSDTGSHLQFRSVDGLRAATWTQDQDGAVRSSFAPIPAGTDPTPRPRIVGYFAVDSALGLSDAREGGSPVFTVSKDNQPVRVGANNDGVITGAYSEARSGGGRAVWAFPGTDLDYRGMATGDYKLGVQKRHQQGNSLVYGIDHQFLIGAQSARLTAIAGEELSHDVLRGGTTTYVMAINNTGSANDTFSLTAEFVSGTPAVGWGISIGGPHALGNQVQLAPGEEKLVTATVSAPFANLGDSSVFLVTARSTVDPAGESASVTLVSRVSDSAKRAVDVIVPAQRVSFDPTAPHAIPVYVLNKGSRAVNATLTIEESASTGWTVDLVDGARRDAITVSSILPGDIARATLLVEGPVGRVATHEVTLNATLLGTPVASAARVVKLAVNPTPGVKVEILDSVADTRHAAELQPDYSARDPSRARRGVPNPDDNVNGVWFRTWITNTGRVHENFDLSLMRLGGGGGSQTCDDNSVFDISDTSRNFTIYYRGLNGAATPQNVVELSPGQTAEVYAWVALRNDPLYMDPASAILSGCPDHSMLNFAVKARGQVTGAEGIAETRLYAEDGTARPKGALLEPIRRLDAYVNNPATPLVDVKNAKETTLRGGIEVGKSATYYVRVTNAAAYKTFVDSEGKTQSSDAIVRVLPLSDPAWNVSIRPRSGDANVLTNPYSKTLYLSNVRENRAEAWIDHEIEVLVQPPPNATLLEGKEFHFSLQAVINGSSDTSTLSVQSVVTRLANVTVVPDAERILAHPAKPGPYLLHVANNGSSMARVNLRATMNPDTTPDRGLGWNVVLSSNSFDLAANSNRTVALLVTPPAGAANSQVGEINVTWEYAPTDMPTLRQNRSARLFTEVVPADSLVLAASDTTVTAAPGGFANFTFSLSSTRPVHFRASATPIPSWDSFLSTAEGNLTPNVPQTVTLVLRVPADAVNDTTFSSVVRVVEVENGNNFDAIPVAVNIKGGRAIAAISAPTLQKTVDRGSSRTFEVQVSNVGNAAGVLNLEARTLDPLWGAFITGVNDTSDPYVFLRPNELRTINVTVVAPLLVPENTVVPVEVVAHAPDFTQSARATIQARVHDYGLALSLSPPRVEMVAGTVAEVVLKVRNTGNDNDTLNVSHMTGDFPEWQVVLPVDRVQLEAGAERELRARIESPTGQLPSARTYPFKFYAGTLGGAAVNVSKNETAVASVEVLRYVALDVDGDESPELAVDADKDNRNGYEAFREIRSEGPQTQVVEATIFDGRTRFLLDVPADRHDGIADVWFDPEAVYAYDLEPTHAFDLDGDRAPDYLVDVDRDGEVDHAYVSVSRTYRAAVEIHALGDDRVQFLVNTEGDDRFDRYYDPEGKLVTATQRVNGQDPSIVGIDTDDDGKVDRYYNPQSGSVQSARVANIADFFGTYWYFLALFALVLVVSIVLIVRRRRD